MKIFRRIIVILLSLTVLAISIAAATFFVVTADIHLDISRLETAAETIAVYDAEGQEIADISLQNATKSVRVADLPDVVKQAFLAAEDKNFYRHHGLDYLGIARALLANLRAHSFRQGASTISQQLVKNTHLSNEKTIRRKLKEIKLTRQLERRFSKDAILEMYLNTIYFSHACYGIASASDFYFGKAAEQLSAAEGATLAAIIRSPNNYSPFVNPEKCRNARDGVLRRMLELRFLNETEYRQAVAQPLPQRQERSDSAKSYLSAVYEELENLPFFSPYRFCGGCKIYTYMNPRLQEYLEAVKTDADRSAKSLLIADNQTGGAIAWFSSAGILRRQPGSVLKPLAVYAPAIQENLISPCTPILDERTKFGDYAPANYRDEYAGYISARQALAESRNVPAVKVLNELGIERSEKYLHRLGLPLLDEDKNLALALGGLSEGYTMQEIIGAYSALAREGKYFPIAFIRKIESASGQCLYAHHPQATQAFSEDTAALVNDMLQSAVTNGTAKKLSSLNFPICAKTGTCGNEQGNTDAWSIAYTHQHTFGAWMGNADNTKTDITGGGLPAHYLLLLANRLYNHTTPTPFPVCRDIKVCRLDKAAYERDHLVRLAADDQPERFVFTDLFRAKNCPREVGKIFQLPSDQAKVSYQGSTICIELCHTEYYEYIIKRKNKEKTETIFDGHIQRCFTDKTVQSGQKYIYSITPYYIDDTGKRVYGTEIHSPAVYTKPKIHPLPTEWWKR